MELDHNFAFNCLSIFGTILFTVATCITIFVKLKARWPVSVNCWFCNGNIKVWRQQLNWWFCNSCEQYNGFTKDGDYAYDVPEKYGSSMRSGMQYCEVRTGEGGSYCSSNDLCYECNKNEEFKLSELRRFEASSDRHCDAELKQLKDSLEETHPLCEKCKRSVRNVLQKQARWLTHYKMLFFKRKSVHGLFENRKKSENTLRGLSTVLAAALAYNNRWLLTPMCGLLLQLCICWANSMRKKRYDAVLAFLWCCIIVLITSPGIQLSASDAKNITFPFEHVTQRNLILAIAFVIGLMNALHKSYGRKSIKSIYLKKIKLDRTSSAAEDSLGSEFDVSDHDFDNTLTFAFNGSLPRDSKTPVCRSPTPISSDLVQFPSFKPTVPSPVSLTSLTNNNSKRQNLNPLTKIGPPSTFSLNDSLTTLSALSLSETQYTTRPAKMFEKRIYGTGGGSELFRNLNAAGPRRHVLSPPKLKSVLQTSWVAGGYWQHEGGMDTPSLSRSSSQSSGFGSAGSNFAPSREASVHDFDRCSVVSDATQSCYGPKSIASSYRTLSSLYHPQARNPATQDHRSFVQQQQQQPHVPMSAHFASNAPTFSNGSLYASQNLRTKNAGKSCAESVCSNHTTTIVTTGPIWLSTLLCCSVILNAIVLCTTFLR